MNKTAVAIGPGAKFVREMNEGETWCPHPDGGIIVCHPERKPMWCRFERGAYIQDWINLPAGEAKEG